jgi:hypothetical protein
MQGESSGHVGEPKKRLALIEPSGPEASPIPTRPSSSWRINRTVDGGLELPMKVVQARLGHSTTILTADTHRHLFECVDDGSALAAGGQKLFGICDIAPEAIDILTTEDGFVIC